MIDNLLITLIILTILFFLVRRFRKRSTHSNKLGIEGKLIWTDKGRDTKPFFNNVFNVCILRTKMITLCDPK